MVKLFQAIPFRLCSVKLLSKSMLAFYVNRIMSGNIWLDFKNNAFYLEEIHLEISCVKYGPLYSIFNVLIVMISVWDYVKYAWLHGIPSYTKNCKGYLSIVDGSQHIAFFRSQDSSGSKTTRRNVAVAFLMKPLAEMGIWNTQ